MCGTPQRSSSVPPDRATTSGLELLRFSSTLEQRPPAIGQLLGMELTRVEFGEADFELTTRPLFANPLGTVRGGIAATMLDSAMGAPCTPAGAGTQGQLHSGGADQRREAHR